jgi:hypothetical protein
MRRVENMMRKFLVLGASVLGLLLMATPAQAASAFTATTHISSLSDAIPITCAGAFTGVTSIHATGNGVQHSTVNGAGDFWLTATFEGQGTIVQTAGPLAGQVFTGHVMDWFGLESNLQNNVFHATFNFDGTNAPGQSLRMHAEAQFTVNPDGSPHLTRVDVSCV